MPHLNSQLLGRAIVGERNFPFSHRHRIPGGKALLVLMALQADLQDLSLADMQSDLATLRTRGAPPWLRNAWIAGAGLILPPSLTLPAGWLAVHLYADFDLLAQMTPADIQNDLDLPWYAPGGAAHLTDLPLGQSSLLAWELVCAQHRATSAS